MLVNHRLKNNGTRAKSLHEESLRHIKRLNSKGIIKGSHSGFEQGLLKATNHNWNINEDGKVVSCLSLLVIVFVIGCLHCKKKPHSTVTHVQPGQEKVEKPKTEAKLSKENIITTTTTTTTKVVEIKNVSTASSSKDVTVQTNLEIAPVSSDPSPSLPGTVNEDAPVYKPMILKEATEKPENNQENDKVNELPKPYEASLPKMNPKDRVRSQMQSGRRTSGGRKMSMMAGGAGGAFPSFQSVD